MALVVVFTMAYVFEICIGALPTVILGGAEEEIKLEGLSGGA